MKLLIEQIDDFLFMQSGSEDILKLLKKKAFEEVSGLVPKIKSKESLVEELRQLAVDYGWEFKNGDLGEVYATLGDGAIVFATSNLKKDPVQFRFYSEYFANQVGYPTKIIFDHKGVTEIYPLERIGPDEINFGKNSTRAVWNQGGYRMRDEFAFSEIVVSGGKLTKAILPASDIETLLQDAVSGIFNFGTKKESLYMSLDNVLSEAKIDKHIERLPAEYATLLYQYQDLKPKYIDWVFNQIHKAIKKLDEIDKELFLRTISSSSVVQEIKSIIEKFETLVNNRIIDGSDKDIMKYTLSRNGRNSIYDLFRTKEPELVAAKNEQEFLKRLREKPDYEIIYEDSSYRIAKINNTSAACRLPHGNWCTAHRGPDNMFYHYNKVADGFYYIEHIGQNTNTAVRTFPNTFTITTHNNTEATYLIDYFIDEFIIDSELRDKHKKLDGVPSWVIEKILIYERKV